MQGERVSHARLSEQCTVSLVDRSEGRLQLHKGTTVLLSGSVESTDLLISCAAGLIPPVNTGEKVQANISCSCVHVSCRIIYTLLLLGYVSLNSMIICKVHVFGPGALPIVTGGAQMIPSLLAEWNQYGLALEEYSDVNTQLASPGLQYKVVGQEVVQNSSQHVLLLFLFVEPPPPPPPGVERSVTESLQWTHLMELTSSLRSRLHTILATHVSSVHKATHSALNKVLFNYMTGAKVAALCFTMQVIINSPLQLRSRASQAVSTLAEAVTSIIHHSTNQHFIENCKHLLQVSE